MTLELKLFIGLILHFIGDYIFQNSWLANNKTKKNLPAIIHALIYSLPFLFIVGFSWAIFFIFLTHFFIDRYRLAVYWIKLVNWNWYSDNFGYSKETPTFLSMWLLFIIDNIFHIAINSISIYLNN
jgi:hypothetical protein